MSGQVSDIFIFDIVDDDCTFSLTDVNFFFTCSAILCTASFQTQAAAY